MTLEQRFQAATAERSDMWEHMETIKRYSTLCPRSVEFGVHDCTSTWALLAGRPQKLRSYDIVRRLEVDEVESFAKANEVDFEFIQASTLDIKIGEETDLLFIDSLHTYEQLKKELELHAHWIAQFILIHDTTTFEFVDETGSGQGLWPAISEFLSSSEIWKIDTRFKNCHGLTILERVIPRPL